MSGAAARESGAIHREHPPHPSRSFIGLAPARGPCRHVKRFLLLPFCSAARRHKLARHRRSCYLWALYLWALFCSRTRPWRPFAGAIGTTATSFGTGAPTAPTAATAIPRTQAAGCAVSTAPRPALLLKFSGLSFVAAAAGWTRRPRARNAHDEVPPAPQGSRAPVYSPRVRLRPTRSSNPTRSSIPSAGDGHASIPAAPQARACIEALLQGPERKIEMATLSA